MGYDSMGSLAVMLRDTSFGVDLVIGSILGQGREALVKWTSIKRKRKTVVGPYEGAWTCGFKATMDDIHCHLCVLISPVTTYPSVNM